MAFEKILQNVERYYAGKLHQHGATARGVDWNSADSQRLRFQQLLKVCEDEVPFVINDYGCGYGALFDYLSGSGADFTYRGFDVSEDMIAEALRLHPNAGRCRFTCDESSLEPADYSVASGVFNVKMDFEVEQWEKYVKSTIGRLALLSTRGFAFNVLTAYSDPEFRRSDLYYADPLALFDHCRRRYSKWVALLHDYGLYEFTILVRRKGESSWLDL